MVVFSMYASSPISETGFTPRDAPMCWTEYQNVGNVTSTSIPRPDCA